METLLNQSGSVKMYVNNNAYLVNYKQPLEIQKGKEYIVVEGVLKEVISKSLSTPSPFVDVLKRYAPKSFLPNHLYDEDSLKVWLMSNRGNVSENSKRHIFDTDLEFNDNKYWKGDVLMLDLEYRIIENKVYALYDIDGKGFYFLCTIKENNHYLIITSEDNDIYTVSKSDFFEKYSLYLGLYISRKV